MIIKSLILKNIRSYKEATINFPLGSVLLSGDIGSGKSTVLLSIEFALFGIKRGDFSGSTLLRHGEKEGFCELCFIIDNNTYTIKRILKKIPKGVKQDNGYIIINNSKYDLTAEELKAKILEILGYPQSLLKKGKDYVYRFTVYTPQEEMKAILFEKPDDRLDILRKIFGIDRYKLMRENALIYIYELKSKKRELEGKCYGIEEKIKIFEQKKKEQEKLSVELTLKKDLWEKEKNILTQKQDKLNELEEKIKYFNEINNSIIIIDTKLMDLFLQRKKNLQKIEEISNDLIKYKQNINFDLKEIDYKLLIEENDNLIQKKLNELNKINEKISYNNALINNSKKTIDKIKNLDKCPMCEQNVDLNYKKSIFERESENILKLEHEIKQINNNKTTFANDINELKIKIKELNNKFIESKALIEKKKLVILKENEIKTIENELLEIKTNIGKLNLEKQQKNKEIIGFSEFNKKVLEIKEEINKITINERKLQNDFISVNTIFLENKKTIILYETEIKQKLGFREKINIINNIITWFDNFFIKICSLIEKKVFGQIYNEFNILFIDWFKMLIEDESLSVRLDDSFSPIIEQNGFETEIINLSGGEKTAIALAYRLSLNKVINDFITNIKTKDLLMLDEPTDGFSDLQLDNVKKVIAQLNIKQNIIVSHEPKMESFVENVLFIVKDNFESKII
jgi:DNA repair protein SbcC/Rad50